jgi:hypothetical protein
VLALWSGAPTRVPWSSPSPSVDPFERCSSIDASRESDVRAGAAPKSQGQRTCQGWARAVTRRRAVSSVETAT